MKRREFLAALVTIAPVPAIAAFGRIPCRRAVLIQQSKLAGFQYHEGERLWPRLQVGDRLNLIREPENKYDKRAVRVEWHGRKLGYSSGAGHATRSRASFR